MYARNSIATGLFLTLVAAIAVVGCANPADDKPEATVSETVETQPAIESGESLVISTDSKIEFVGSKVTGSHDGGFKMFEGEIQLVDADPLRSSVRLSIDTTSLWADDDRLTGHLKSADFFDVETFPTATFESTSVVASDDGYTVTGNLDLHGVDKSIAFPAQIEVGPDRVTAKAEFVIQRFDFGIEYKGKADNLIRDEVVIRFDLAAAR